MLLALLVLLGVAVDDADGQWATSSFGYAASSVDAYIYGSGTTLFNGVSSNSPSYAPPAPTPATCASRGSRARCEDVALYDSDGLYCSWEGGACRDLAREASCASGAVTVSGTSVDVSAVLAGVPSDLFDGGYVERPARFGGFPVYASTSASPSLVVYHCDDAAKFGSDGAWLAHAFFGDGGDDDALAAELAACPHLVQWQSGERLAGASRALNAVAASQTDVSTRATTVAVSCVEAMPCAASTSGSTVVLAGARLGTAGGDDYGIWDGAYAESGLPRVDFMPVLKRAGALYDFYAYYCARAATWIVTTLEGVDGSCTGYVLWAAADRRVSVADVSGGFAAAASAAVTCDAATACAPGSQLELAGTSLDWGGSDGTRLPANYLDGVYFESDVANDGLATYASETVDGLKVVPCGEKWHIAFGESPCDVAAGIVLGFVASPGLGGGGTVATNRQVDGCAEGVYPCLYDAVEGASATCTATQGEEEDEEQQKKESEVEIEADAAARRAAGLLGAAVAAALALLL